MSLTLIGILILVAVVGIYFWFEHKQSQKRAKARQEFSHKINHLKNKELGALIMSLNAPSWKFYDAVVLMYDRYFMESPEKQALHTVYKYEAFLLALPSTKLQELKNNMDQEFSTIKQVKAELAARGKNAKRREADPNGWHWYVNEGPTSNAFHDDVYRKFFSTTETE